MSPVYHEACDWRFEVSSVNVVSLDIGANTVWQITAGQNNLNRDRNMINVIELYEV